MGHQINIVHRARRDTVIWPCLFKAMMVIARQGLLVRSVAALETCLGRAVMEGGSDGRAVLVRHRFRSVVTAGPCPAMHPPRALRLLDYA